MNRAAATTAETMRGENAEPGSAPSAEAGSARRKGQGAISGQGGLFISFEGIDGAGKSSHIGALAEAFNRAGRVVCLTREPGGTPLAERIRSLFLHEEMDALTESLLVFASRRDHLRRVIEPALARGEVVLCDRFTDATFAYQGGGRGFDADVLSALERWVQAGPDGALVQPDCTLWFELPADVAAARLAGVREADRFEGQTRGFFERVTAAYAARAIAEPGRFERIDAALDRESVAALVLGVVSARGWLAASAAS